MKSKYQNYYDKLKGKDFSVYVSKYNNAINDIKSKMGDASKSIASSSSSWNEKGLNTIQDNTIPEILRNASSLESDLVALSSAASKAGTLVAKLEILDDTCKEYEVAKDENKASLESKISSLENEIDDIILDINGTSLTGVQKTDNNYQLLTLTIDKFISFNFNIYTC